MLPPLNADELRATRGMLRQVGKEMSGPLRPEASVALALLSAWQHGVDLELQMERLQSVAAQPAAHEEPHVPRLDLSKSAEPGAALVGESFERTTSKEDFASASHQAEYKSSDQLAAHEGGAPLSARSDGGRSHRDDDEESLLTAREVEDKDKRYEQPRSESRRSENPCRVCENNCMQM